MHDYLFGAEVVRLAFVAGVVVSLAFYQRTHLTTGSIVVPGYVGLFLFLPLTVVATFVNALTTYWVVNKVIRKRVLSRRSAAVECRPEGVRGPRHGRSRARAWQGPHERRQRRRA